MARKEEFAVDSGGQGTGSSTGGRRGEDARPAGAQSREESDEKSKSAASIPIPKPVIFNLSSINRYPQYNKPTESQPFWKTDGFKTFITNIKSGINARGSTPTESIALTPKSNVIPETNYIKRPTLKVIESQIRKDVWNNITPQQGASKDRIKKYVDEQVKQQMDVYKKPRFIFLSDGTPLYLNDHEERKDYLNSIKDKPWAERTWAQIKYDIPNSIVGMLKSLGEPSLKTKEMLTDTDQPNPLGALAQLGLNTTILGIEYLRTGVSLTYSEKGLQDLEQRKLEATQNGTLDDFMGVGTVGEHLDREIEIAKSQLAFQRSYADRLKVAKQAVSNSWAQLNNAKQAAERGEGPPTGYGPEAFKRREEYFEKLRQEEQAAKVVAASFREQAATAYANGDYTAAMGLISQAQESDRKADPMDAYGAYTWVREPERYDLFLQDTVLAEIQKGAPLTTEEIRRIREYHSNSWTEISGELIYDPLNLIPAAMMEDIVKLPGRLVKSSVKAVSTEIPVVGKAIDIMGSPVKWLRRQSVTSGGNEIARQTHNLLDRVSKAYATSDEMVKAVDDMSDVAMQMKRAVTQEESIAVFNAGKKSIPGMQNVTYNEFKQLVDAGDSLDPALWGKTYNDALINAEDVLTASALRNGKDPAVVVSDVAKSRLAMQEMSSEFYKAYVDPHRIYKGASLTDDTISGWISKTMRELSGDEVTDVLKTQKFDQYVIKYGETLNPKVRWAIQHANKAGESILHTASFLRDLWTTAVLSTPRWLVTNLADTSFRDLVWGGNLWDDMATLLTSSQRTLADDLGFIPIEFSQALARADLDVAETVTSRLLYEDWKPKAGIFSYWNAEYKRLLGTDNIAAKRDILNGILAGVPEGKLKNSLMWLGDGLNVRMPTVLSSWKGAVADFNTAIEFTFRLRMFHREYFKLLEVIEPSVLARGLEGLSPATSDIAQQIWKLSEGNPARLSGYVDNIIGKSPKGAPAQWSMVVPKNIDELTKGMDATSRQLFVSQVRSSLDEMIQAAESTGKKLDAADFNKFMDDYKVKLQDEIQHHLSQTWDKRAIDGTIDKNSLTATVPQVSDLKGSAPHQVLESPRTQQAAQRLKKSKPFQKTSNVVDDFGNAISSYASVERIPGDGIRRTVKNGKTVISIGDNVLKGTTTAVYAQLNEVLLDVFKHADEAVVLRGGFQSLDEYDTVVRQFMDDPTRLLADNERQFMTISNQFTSHSNLKDLIERTGKKFNFDSAMDIYRNTGVYDDVYGFTRPPEQLDEMVAQKLRPLPGHHIAAAQNEALSTVKLSRLETSLPDAVSSKVAQFREYWDTYRKQLKQFYSFNYPGPLHISSGQARQGAWDSFYEIGTDAYNKEAKIKNELMEMFASDPAAAEKYVDDALSDFGSYFLKENGFDVAWDSGRQMVTDIKFTYQGKTRSFISRSDRASLQRRFFTSDINKKLAENPILKLRTDAPTQLKNQLRNALRDTFEMPTSRAEMWTKVIDNHAQKWASETGQDISKYYERLGFQRLENGMGLGTKENFRVVKKGAVQRADGEFIFYGLGQSNFESVVRETGELFYDDLISMAEHSTKSSDDLRVLNEYIEQATGVPVRGDKLNQKQSEVFTEVFTRYVAEGVGPDIKLKRPFESFKAYLSDTFDAVHTTPLGQELSDDVYRRLDGLFTESKMTVKPASNARAIKLMAKEAGLEFADDAAILQKINDTTFLPSPRTEWTDIENNLARGLDVSPKELADRPVLQAAFDDSVSVYPSNGEITIPKQKGLTKEQRVVEARFVEEINADTQGMIERYWTTPPPKERNVLNVDYARELSPDYAKDMASRRDYAAAVQKPSSMLVRKMWDEKIAAPLRGVSTADRVVFTVGGGGVGKTTALQSVSSINSSLHSANVVWDTTLSEARDLAYIEQALDSGRKVEMVFVARDPVESLLGIVKRSEIEGRSVPLDVWAAAHAGSPETFRTAINKFGDNPNLHLIVIDNTKGYGNAAEVPLDFMDNWKYNADELKQQGLEALRKEVANGELRPELYKAIVGDEYRGADRVSELTKAPGAGASQSGPVPAGALQPGAGNVDQPLTRTPVIYKSLGEVPKDVAAKALSTTGKPIQTKINTEINEAWDMWKQQRALQGFPDEALATSDTFKAYLTERMSKEWSEASWQYNKLLAETEQFESALMKYHSGGEDFATHFAPRVPEAQLSDGMKTWIRNNESMLSNYESAIRALDGWKSHLDDLSRGVDPARAMTSAQKAELAQWAERASTDKAEMISTLLNGGASNGKNYEGAINTVNRVMLDYQHRNIADQFMRNIFPFWMFPSRSLPFWIETMATHPQLIAAYEKIQRMSRSQRFQAGAVTSTGKPMPSLDGYIQIPGTDLWFNPLAPLSFRYVLDVWKTLDDMAYQQTKDDDADPKAFLAKELMDTSQIYGFSMAPWVSFLLKKQFNLSDEIVPRFPLIPQISLIPRWFVQDMIHKANKVNFFGVQGWGDGIYPEATWHDYLVERRILENGLQQIQDGNLTQAQRDKLRVDMANAIKVKGNNEMWQATYKDITNDETARSWGSFFTGIYAKPFTSGQADLLKLRNDINLLKSSMNNEFQTAVFDLPEDAEDAYDNYVNKLGTDEGWVARLYTDIGWVKNDMGQSVSGEEERNKWLAIQIENDENQSLYYQRSSDVYTEYNARLRALPIGSTYEQQQPVYEWLQSELDAIDYLRQEKTHYYTNKPMELIQKDLKDEFLRSIMRLQPRWNTTQNETYTEYQQRLTEWNANLPKLAQSMMPAFIRKRSTEALMQALRDDQRFDQSFFVGVANNTNVETVAEWQKENDDIFDALNNAWKATYWDEYWDSGVLDGGYSSDLAEQEFVAKHPTPPTADDLFGWIQQTYGDRFTLEEVQKWTGESGSLNIEERRLEGQEDPEDYAMRQQIWEMLSWLGPGSRNRDVFNKAFQENGGDLDMLTVWYAESGNAFNTHPEKLQSLFDTLKSTSQALDLQAPPRAELVRFIQAQEENETFKGLVKAELGEEFYDLLDFYNSKDTAGRRDFRDEQPEMYNVIQDYYSFKEEYGEGNPLWADYYGFDLVPTVGVDPEVNTSPTYKGGNFSLPSANYNKEKSYSMIPSKGQAEYDPQPYFGMQSRLSSTYPPEFTRAVGNNLMWEIGALFANNRKLSNAAKSFISGLSSRHPEWNDLIFDIMRKNGA